MVPRRPMNTGLTKPGRKPTTAQSIHCQVLTLVHLA
jgi:hypothetical protein